MEPSFVPGSVKRWLVPGLCLVVVVIGAVLCGFEFVYPHVGAETRGQIVRSQSGLFPGFTYTYSDMTGQTHEATSWRKRPSQVGETVRVGYLRHLPSVSRIRDPHLVGLAVDGGAMFTGLLLVGLGVTVLVAWVRWQLDEAAGIHYRRRSPLLDDSGPLPRNP